MRKRAKARQDDVLNVLNASVSPMAGYQFPERLTIGEPGMSRPTKHHMFSALTHQWRAHRPDSKKTFVPGRCNHVECLPGLAICEDCGAVDMHDVSGPLPQLTALKYQSAFRADRRKVEIHGQCGTRTAQSLSPSIKWDQS